MLPIAIVIPHAGIERPSELNGRLAITPEQIFNEADIFADQLFDFRDEVLHWVKFPYARAILDMNRPNDPSRIRPGDGIVKWQTSYGDPIYLPNQRPDAELEQQLIDKYWQPWHAQLAAIAQDERVKLVIDAHSMAAVGPGKYDDPGARRPFVSVSNFGDKNGEASAQRDRLTAPPNLTRWFAQKLETALLDVPLFAETQQTAGINSPFYGGWDIYQHGTGHQPWFMVEINRALYVGDQTGSSPIQPANQTQIQLLRERIWDVLVELDSKL